MRILYTGQFRVPDLDAGSTRVLEVSKLLKDIGHEVCIAGWNEGRAEFSYDGFMYGCLGEYSEKSNRSFIERVFGFVGLGRKTVSHLIANKYDLVVVYNPTAISLVRILIAVRKLKSTLVVDLTEWYDGRHFPGGKYGLPSLDNSLKMRILLRMLKLDMIVISRYLESEYSDSNTVLVPPLFDVTARPSLESCGVNSERNVRTFVYIGSPGRKDNLDLVVRAFLLQFTECNPSKLVVVGLSKSQFESVYKTSLDENLKCISFRGRLDKSEALSVYAEADFSVFVRDVARFTKAGFPSKFVESVSFGVPVITNNTSDLAHYVNGGLSSLMLTNPVTERSLAHIMGQAVLMDNSELFRLRSLARSMAVTSFAKEKYRYPMIKFLESIIDDS